MSSERGRISGSFLIAAGAVVLALVGYGAWSFLRPDHYVLSERVVRDARRALASEVREFQRDADNAVRDAKRHGKDAVGQIDKLVADALKRVDRVVENARDQLGALDIELRTQRNRMERVTSRAQEARDMIEEHAEQSKAKTKAGGQT